MYAVVLKFKSMILTIHTFISELLPLVIVGVTVTVVSKGPSIAKIGNSKNT